MDSINLMKYWVDSSDEDYDAMQVMYKNKKNTWTLFLGHLVIEKLLKGLYAKKNEENPYTKYRILYISKETGKPTKMEIKDNSKKTLIYILYKEVKFQ